MPMTLEPPARLHPLLPPALPPIALALLCAALLAACAAPESRPAALMDAYAAVDAARSDRKVRAFAPAGLHEAETTLAQAFRAWQAGQPEHEVSRLAHLARQRAGIARSQAVASARDEIEILRAQAPRPATEPPDAGTPAIDAAATLVPDADPLLPAAGEPPAPQRSPR
jgi:Domain of unknown function (DUF4398)